MPMCVRSLEWSIPSWPSGETTRTGGWAVSVSYSFPDLAERFVGRSGPLQFTTDAPIDQALAVVRTAAHTALPEGDPDGPNIVYDSVGPSEGGPIIFITHCDTRELLAQFLTQLAANLEAAGWSGRLAPARRFEPPRVWAPAMSLNAVALLDWDVALSSEPTGTDTPYPGWWVDPVLTRRLLTPVLEWCLQGPGQVYLQAGGSSMVVGRDAVVELVLHERGWHAARDNVEVLVLDQSPEALKRAAVGINGEFLVESRDLSRGWAEQQADLARLADSVAPDLANAFLRVNPATASAGREAALKAPPAGVRAGGNTWMYAHLETGYLFDAHGYQVVTTDHLDRIGELDPSRWRVQALGSDRHSITHHNLSAWLDVDPTPYSRGDTIQQRPQVPPEPILQQARRDFANALITPEVVTAKPSPPMRETTD
jgi:hypothetical protein